ncbi:hypothetical protein PTSG_07481 [Salpingoeca rosetta]|uniref:Uncharacterized protein n=1 Tax=Salpingoeca rosetta (strain ATCC 50818 / BSB-021) TaxID=946362 RepID=F2UIU8_SALR5|nr:uncharacterized protein PTSG_07481 [Salpingoeca rosetta]EGD77147.1 hypothetical protein PTSG_07481 [Salpingoeca rosetta]|eukprot:XP_004990986.1 hypothetical protein PTSG_07481 [Salpingoeca rosetta]
MLRRLRGWRREKRKGGGGSDKEGKEEEEDPLFVERQDGGPINWELLTTILSQLQQQPYTPKEQQQEDMEEAEQAATRDGGVTGEEKTQEESDKGGQGSSSSEPHDAQQTVEGETASPDDDTNHNNSLNGTQNGSEHDNAASSNDDDATTAKNNTTSSNDDDATTAKNNTTSNNDDDATTATNNAAMRSGDDESHQGDGSTTAGSLPSVAERGVSLEYLFQWWKEHKDKLPEDITTREVVDKVIRPATEDAKQCLWTQVPEDHRSVPTAAVSHTWNYTMAFLMDMLHASKHTGHAPLSGHTYVWLDIFALVQHADGTSVQREEISQLGAVFGEKVRTVIQVLPPSRGIMMRNFGLRQRKRAGDLGAFDRAWCIFELARAVASGATYHVACPDSNTDYQTPFNFAGAWQPYASDALYQSDKENIDSLVLEAFGTWNTLKAVVVMVMLKANNVGPIFRWDANVPTMYAKWEDAFLGSEETSWSRFIQIYRTFYHDELPRAS